MDTNKVRPDYISVDHDCFWIDTIIYVLSSSNWIYQSNTYNINNRMLNKLLVYTRIDSTTAKK